MKGVFQMLGSVYFFLLKEALQNAGNAKHLDQISNLSLQRSQKQSKLRARRNRLGLLKTPHHLIAVL